MSRPNETIIPSVFKPKEVKSWEHMIMTDEQIITLGHLCGKDFSRIDFPELPEFLIAQAEIAWDKGFGAGKQEGIREVVEWVEQNRKPLFNLSGWQVKLKEWGIEWKIVN